MECLLVSGFFVGIYGCVGNGVGVVVDGEDGCSYVWFDVN